MHIENSAMRICKVDETGFNQTSQLSLFHSGTQGFWSILEVIPSNLTVKSVCLTQNDEPTNHPK